MMPGCDDTRLERFRAGLRTARAAVRGRTPAPAKPRGPRIAPRTVARLAEAVRAMTAEGWNRDEIAGELDIHPDHVSRIRRLHGIVPWIHARNA